MRQLVISDESACVGCNKCVRECPMEGASLTYTNNGHIKVKVNENRCIACGACIRACRHQARDYMDDTERFLRDLKSGVPISLFAAPAVRVGGLDGGRVFAWLRKMGVKKIYDVSLGADICIWAHIRFIQREKPKSLITQPCPAIVNYILLYERDLIKYLSPVQSPMLCTAVYMKKYRGVTDGIAALSPCIAKSHEFEDTRYINYNVTLKKLYEYITSHNIQLPEEPVGFDHEEAALGRLFSMPGGLKENIEFYLGKQLRIDQAEGQEIVYDALKLFAGQRESDLPALFDVLNCPEGCNIGTGCFHGSNRFEVGAVMDKNRRTVLSGPDRAQCDALHQKFDEMFRLDDFLRRYTPKNAAESRVSDEQIEKAFVALGKLTDEKKTFDCGACGSESCYDMARRIARGFDIPSNCVQNEKDVIELDHERIVNLSNVNLDNIDKILNDISSISGLSNEIVASIGSVTEAIGQFGKMSKEITSISQQINILSLNASIEAARAGAHGKAFAVVAQEVKALANKSQQTVSQTGRISGAAAGSIAAINAKITNISAAIDQAHTEISDIYNATQDTLKDFSA
ncbi:MAG: methyl-accepting chemotaxis protein [Gracilibacteraceae bacterium]|jgi:Na+-translocating ferredoxin:NAD+ oxidoreductase RNF subunit RnfB|nr:methyl-accepting chemotaxis protein [Gracilibacteraceae bacterium]